MSLSEIVEDILHVHDNTKVGICCSFLVIFIAQYLQFIYKEVLSLEQRCVNKRIFLKKCQFSIKIYHVVLRKKEHV